MKASEHKVDKGKLSRSLKLNLESLIQLGNDSTECLKVTCNREGALCQRNCPVCQDKKEIHPEQRRGTAATQPCQGRGCETSRRGKGMRNGTFLPRWARRAPPCDSALEVSWLETLWASRVICENRKS
uniref:Uncharacterized protein n=1 Tax=Molossus molossus TaxID=27622 RepID=A0A7J8FTT0_MOLMO|nr:hypothetical protein HJG59_008419 [Molossus molossus]